MLRKVVDISTEGLFLNHHRGFLVVNSKDNGKTEIPITDISILVLSAQGITLTKDIIVSLISQGSVIVLCGSKYTPESIICPLFGNYEFTGRLNEQIEASVPLKKRIWQSIIKEKINNQAKLLEIIGCLNEANLLKENALEVKSGDTTNREAFSARKYWSVVYGKGFIRDQNGIDYINSFLNYGYSVLRGMVSRSVCSAGLHPSLGLFHHSKVDNMCLVDDLMEPFRVIVEKMVYVQCLQKKDFNIVNWKKKIISELPDYEVNYKGDFTKLSFALDYYSNSLIQSFQAKENSICIPKIVIDKNLVRIG